jgi:hypothetical protein
MINVTDPGNGGNALTGNVLCFIVHAPYPGVLLPYVDDFSNLFINATTRRGPRTE